MDEDSDGVRVKIIPCVKQQFRRRVEATRVLNDDFYVPNRAQLMLNFLQKHGDRVVQETPGPGDASQTRFSLFSMLCRNHQVIVSDCSQTCQDVIQESNFPSTEGCVCVYTLILSYGFWR